VPARILVIDNYDSFTWNLVQGLEALGAEAEVIRNDAESVPALLARAPAGVVVSPGPGGPAGAGLTLSALRAFASARVPVLGVCLGHQAVAEAFGGRVVRARHPRHGKTVAVRHDGRGLLRGLPDPLEAMLYHSLVVEEPSLPAVLEVVARGPEGEVMALRHRTLPVAGVQFHPESIGTPSGSRLLANFLAACAAPCSAGAAA
jgi:anthranilate synthase/aminodeoxychorismate synthase-like glutamine amidotransferase